MDAMQRAMQRNDEAADGLDRERQGLLERLRGAEQVGMGGCMLGWRAAALQ